MQPIEVCPAPSETPNTPTAEQQSIGDDYKKLEAFLYAYMFGAISFLELLTIFEHTLNVTPADQARLK